MHDRKLTVAALLMLMLFAAAGCQPGRDTDDRAVPQAPPPAAGVPRDVPAASPSATVKTPLKDAVESLLSRSGDNSPFPKGTRLLSANLKDRVATLDFSKEFGALANSGDATESEAQKLLRSSLASLPGVDKMRVTVEGKPFDSQATDWNTPFPVRDGAGNPDGGGVSSGNGGDSGAATRSGGGRN